MSEIIAPKTEAIMDAAYKRWQDNRMTKEDFWWSLTPREKVAVFCGNLNYQVENGGWSQWDENDYSDCAPDLRRILPRLGEHGKHVLDLMNQVLTAHDKLGEKNRWGYRDADDWEYEQVMDEIDPLSSEFYTFNDKFFAEVEAVCAMSDDDFNAWLTKPLE